MSLTFQLTSQTITNPNPTDPTNASVTVHSQQHTLVNNEVAAIGAFFASQAANKVLAGPTSGGAAAPTYRSLVDADIPKSLSGPINFGSNLANYIQASGAGTGSAPSLAAVGGDANIDLQLIPKGSGKVFVSTSVIPIFLFKSNSAVNTPAIEIQDAAATPNRWWLASGLGSPTDGIFGIYDARQSINRLAINTNGVVGINTIIPVVSGTGKLHMAADTFRLDTARTPASSSSTGNAGEYCWDSNYLYICIANATWRRVAHVTW